MEEPRRCWRLRRLRTDGRDDLLLVRINPPLIGQKYGLGDLDIDRVVLAPRHRGASLFPVSEWPIYVHVARLTIELPEGHDSLRDEELELIAWAELYRTTEEARRR